METSDLDVVILSDLHLGSETSRAREALRLLASLSFRRLILLGDIFCDLNFRRLKKEHWHFLSYVRKLSNPKRGIEVIWVEGNHDHGLTDVMSHLVGVPVFREYLWEAAGERHLAIHGHQFDKFFAGSFLVDELATRLYVRLQKLDRGRRHFSRMLDKLDTRWQRLTPRVAKGALDYAGSRGASRVFCGHTHEAITMARNGIRYYNTGSWTNSRPTYVAIKGEVIHIQEYLEEADDCYAAQGQDKRTECTIPESQLALALSGSLEERHAFSD